VRSNVIIVGSFGLKHLIDVGRRIGKNEFPRKLFGGERTCTWDD
jgi:hypothetical protein